MTDNPRARELLADILEFTTPTNAGWLRTGEASALTVYRNELDILTRALASPQDVGERAALRQCQSLAADGFAFTGDDGGTAAETFVSIHRTAASALSAGHGGDDSNLASAPAQPEQEERRAWPGVNSVLSSYMPAARPVYEDELAEKLMTDFYCGPTYDPAGRAADNMKAAIKLALASRPTQGRKVREALESIASIDRAWVAAHGGPDAAINDIIGHALAALSTPLDPPEANTISGGVKVADRFQDWWESSDRKTAFDNKNMSQRAFRAAYEAGLEEAIHALHTRLEYPTEACAIVRSLIQSAQGGVGK